jgi:DNA-binding PadR family transcriptional regulator
MDALLATEPRRSVSLAGTDQRRDMILEALRWAVAVPGEHRLYRTGKLPGLFALRTGLPAEAAVAALAEGYLETTRTEERGRWFVEWVRITPKGVEVVHEHDSPQAVLRQLQAILGRTREGVPLWMEDTRTTILSVVDRFERQAGEMLARLDVLTERVEAAILRADLVTTERPEPANKLWPWAEAALRYLDRRSQAGASGACPLGELFHAIRTEELTVPDFHAGLMRMHQARALRLSAVSGLPYTVATDPEYTLMAENEIYAFVKR